MDPKWVPKWSQNQAEERGASGRASGSDLGGFWGLKKLPRGSPERPRRDPGAPQDAQSEPQEVQNERQEAPNDPQEGEKEPQEGQSELWEASGSVLGRISDAFPSNARRPRRSLLKPPARARSARARLQAGAAARMFSQPSPGSSQKVPETSTRNSRNAPAPNARPARAACFRSLPRDRARKLRKRRTRNSRLCLVVLCLLLLAVACARLLVFSVACDACGSRFSRASRSLLARFMGKIG